MNRCIQILVLLTATGLTACTSLPAVKSAEPPEQPIPPPIPTYIMGTGHAPVQALASFLRQHNPHIPEKEALLMATLYYQEGAAEGVNPDIAFVQMCLETSFLRFGGLVTPDMHNYCGLGSMGPDKPGERFPSAQLGVRAHIQHLKAYGSTEGLRQPLVDPRFKYVRRGSAPTIHDLAGRWASDRSYGTKLEDLLKRLYRSAFDGKASQIPR